MCIYLKIGGKYFRYDDNNKSQFSKKNNFYSIWSHLWMFQDPDRDPVPNPEKKLDPDPVLDPEK